MTKHFTSNLLFFFAYLHSVCPTREGFFVLAIVEFHFFLSSKTNTFGSLGTFLATIGVFFLNQLRNQCESNLSIFCTFLWSILPTGGQILRSPFLFRDFSLGSKSDILGRFGTFPAHIGGFFLNELANHCRSN